MKLQLAFLALSIACIGCASSQGSTPVDWDEWAFFSWEQLRIMTPVYASAWTYASADAVNDNCYITDPWTFTYTSTIIDDVSEVKSSREGPDAVIGASTQSISAFGDKDSGWLSSEVMFTPVPLNPAFDNVAVAQTTGYLEATGVCQAWAVLPMQSMTWVNSAESHSESWAVGAARSDFEDDGCHGCCGSCNYCDC
ncbi:MAG: hypothetical protein HPY61_01710 [Methanotrichaceae archaeon]|nr:hypothetical protein [Methanotrichaceae archaeon]